MLGTIDPAWSESEALLYDSAQFPPRKGDRSSIIGLFGSPRPDGDDGCQSVFG